MHTPSSSQTPSRQKWNEWWSPTLMPPVVRGATQCHHVTIMWNMSCCWAFHWEKPTSGGRQTRLCLSTWVYSMLWSAQHLQLTFSSRKQEQATQYEQVSMWHSLLNYRTGTTFGGEKDLNPTLLKSAFPPPFEHYWTGLSHILNSCRPPGVTTTDPLGRWGGGYRKQETSRATEKPVAEWRL